MGFAWDVDVAGRGSISYVWIGLVRGATRVSNDGLNDEI